MASIYDQKPTTFAPSALINNPSGQAPPPTGGHPAATSGGGSSSLGFGPVLTPEQQTQFANLGLVESVGGGYLSNLNPWTGKPPSQEDMQNANSAYNKFGPMNANNYYVKTGQSDPAANARAIKFYNDVGNDPTAPNLTPAASMLAAQTPGYTSKLGPSINDRLGQPWQGPWAIPGQ